MEGTLAAGFGTAWVREKMERRVKRNVTKVYMMMVVFGWARLVWVCALLGVCCGWRLPRRVEQCGEFE
jgi:hypothetical protein